MECLHLRALSARDLSLPIVSTQVTPGHLEGQLGRGIPEFWLEIPETVEIVFQRLGD